VIVLKHFSGTGVLILEMCSSLLVSELMCCQLWHTDRCVLFHTKRLL